MSEKIEASAEQVITGIWGPEPLRAGEYPDCRLVGHAGVTRIEQREQNLGTYGIVWFDVFKGDKLAWSLNASFVASLRIGAPE